MAETKNARIPVAAPLYDASGENVHITKKERLLKSFEKQRFNLLK